MREGKHEHRGRSHDEHRERKGRNPEDKKHFRSAQTFRRGRALAFLERLNIRRNTLLTQLEQPEYESIRQVISGELKATDTIIQEFIHMFELVEKDEDMNQPDRDSRIGKNHEAEDQENKIENPVIQINEDTDPEGKDA
ncbi:hypothetical protein [Paenibacillus bovis]|uniref:2-keto-3-deoxygluconate kinase n=1 Tax=Paenibacillus bovis TaxID=1616788 RepID=A0A172ZHM8_9BACL|nr:hypothetical protein [Paenibacillus bovis]ANF97088.1 hypothetical protein AR543_14465 [Paenibacillus bovis]